MNEYEGDVNWSRIAAKAFEEFLEKALPPVWRELEAELQGTIFSRHKEPGGD